MSCVTHEKFQAKIYEIEIRPSFLFHSFLLEVKVLNTNSETQIEMSESLDDSEGINANSEHFRSLKWLLAKQKKVTDGFIENDENRNTIT